MQNSTNVFSKGMISDMHPLSTPLDVYTDALNATLLTYNGNENMMQNDMGNTLIQDAKTGNLMGLRPGFIPVGMVEHGGVMYIASVNKLGQGEIGMIPSPVIQFNKDKTYVIDNLLDSNLFQQLITENRTESDLAKLTTDKISAGELFATVLLIEDELNPNKVIVPFKLMGMSEPLRLIYPKFSLDTELESDEERKFKSIYGLYKVNLYAKTDDLMFSLSDQTSVRHTFYTTDSVEPENQCYYWFYATDKNPLDVVLDLDLMIANNHSDDNPYPSFLRYPNVASGYPSVSIEKDIRITDFTLSPNFNVYKESGDTEERQHPHAHPVTFFDKEGTGKYYIMFPEFWYKANSAVNIDRIKVYVTNSTTGEKVTLFRKNPIIETGEELELTGLDRYIRPNLSKLRVPMWNDSFGNFEPGDEWFKLTNANQLNNAVPTDELTYKYASLWSDDKKLNNDYRNESLFYFSIDGSLNQWYTLHVDYYNNNWDYPIGSYDLDFNQYQMDIKHNYQEIDITYEFEYPGVQIEEPDTLKYAKIHLYYSKDDSQPKILTFRNASSLIDSKSSVSVDRYWIRCDFFNSAHFIYDNGEYLYKLKLDKVYSFNIDQHVLHTNDESIYFLWKLNFHTYRSSVIFNEAYRWNESSATVYLELQTKNSDGVYEVDYLEAPVSEITNSGGDFRIDIEPDVLYNFIWQRFGEAAGKITNPIDIVVESIVFNMYRDYGFEPESAIETDLVLNFPQETLVCDIAESADEYPHVTFEHPDTFESETNIFGTSCTDRSASSITFTTDVTLPSLKAQYDIIPQFNLVGDVDGTAYRFGLSSTVSEGGILEAIQANLNFNDNYLLFDNRETSSMTYRFGQINSNRFNETSLDISNLLEFKASGSYNLNIRLERGIYYFNVNTFDLLSGHITYSANNLTYIANLMNELLIVVPEAMAITGIEFNNLIYFLSAGLYKVNLFLENSEASQKASELLELSTAPVFITENVDLYAIPQAVWNYSEAKGDESFSKCIDADYELNMLPIHGYQKLYGLYIFNGVDNVTDFLVDGRHFRKQFRYLTSE